MPMPVNTEDDFWAKVLIGSTDECWPWQGAKFEFGHGAACWRGKTLGAHRLAYQLCHNLILMPHECVLHDYDNPPCCNPWHLFQGSKGDNWRDAKATGRIHQGFKVGHPDFRKLRKIA